MVLNLQPRPGKQPNGLGIQTTYRWEVSRSRVFGLSLDATRGRSIPFDPMQASYQIGSSVLY